MKHLLEFAPRWAGVWIVVLMSSLVSAGTQEMILTETELNRREFWRLALSSIAQLVRRSEAIVHGEILAHRIAPGDTVEPRYDRTMDRWILVRVDGLIWGDSAPPPGKIRMRVTSIDRVPEIGSSGWMFVSRKETSQRMLFMGDDTVDDLDLPESDHWILVGGVRGCIGGSDSMIEEMERYARTANQWYRNRDIDATHVAQMLAQMRESEHARLRDDAQYDTRFFYSSLPRGGVQALLDRDDTPEWIRENFIAYRERAASMVRTRSREEFSAHLEEVDFAKKTASDDLVEFSEALNALSHYAPHELKLYEDLWAPHLRAVLRGNNDDLRWRAASHLSYIQCPEAVPVIMNRLRNLESDFPRATLGDLKTATGQDFPFDPRAPEDVRDAQIRVWEEWWEREGREELIRLQRERKKTPDPPMTD